MVQLDRSNKQVPMHQQQTGMYWQTFILTKILTKNPGRLAIATLITVPLSTLNTLWLAILQEAKRYTEEA